MEFEQYPKVSILIDQKRYQAAEKELRKIIAADMESQYPRLLLATCIARQKDRIKDAFVEVEKAMRLDPNDAYANYVVSQLHMQNHDVHQAEYFIKESIRFEPYEADYHASLGLIYFFQHKYNEALVCLDEALLLDAENISALNIRGRCLAALGRLSEMESSFEASMQRDPENPYTHFNQGLVFLEKTEVDKAIASFKQVLRLNPAHEGVKKCLKDAYKGKYWWYRVLLKMQYWHKKKYRKYPGFLFIGLFVACVVVKPLILLLLVLLFVGLMTLVAGDFVLGMHPETRVLLEEEQIRANRIYVFIICLVFGSGLAFFLTNSAFFPSVAIMALSSLYPVWITARIKEDEERRQADMYLIIMLLLGGMSMVMYFFTSMQETAGMLLGLYALLYFTYFFYFNFEPR